MRAVIGRVIPGWTRKTIARLMELATPLNDDVQFRWLRRPDIADEAEVCIFAAYAPDGRLSPHSEFHARAWAKAGFQVILVVNAPLVQGEWLADSTDYAAGVMLRENRGYDFGAWASALKQLPEMREASLAVLANDSMYGPLNSFDRMIQRARTMDGDVIGATESVEFGRHFQSFLTFFKPKALRSEAFWLFWSKVRAGGRLVAVYRYELGMIRAFEHAGLRCVALFQCSDRRNPTLTRWRDLIEGGFPYLKIALLRDNLFEVDLTGWRDVLRDRGFDPSLATWHTR